MIKIKTYSIKIWAHQDSLNLCISGIKSTFVLLHRGIHNDEYTTIDVVLTTTGSTEIPTRPQIFHSCVENVLKSG